MCVLLYTNFLWLSRRLLIIEAKSRWAPSKHDRETIERLDNHERANRATEAKERLLSPHIKSLKHHERLHDNKHKTMPHC